MTVDAHKETLEFKAEVSQVLDLVIRSLYSNKEIFLRELISNASDAAEKLRFEALTDDGLYEDDGELRIRIDVDKEAGTLTVSDNGIGMSRQEVIDTIGSIASSGTRRFLESITGDQAKDSQLIGQFGVGFYSAFIVADKVTLISRRAGLAPEHGVRWESDGRGAYTLETVEKADRGTDVTLHLKDDEKEFLDTWRLRTIIGKFSDHIALPVEMQKEHYDSPEEEEAAKEQGRRSGSRSIAARRSGCATRRSDRGGVQRVLPARLPRLRAAAGLRSTTGWRAPTSTPRLLVRPQARPLGPLGPGPEARRQALCDAASSSWTRPTSCSPTTCASSRAWWTPTTCRSTSPANCSSTTARSTPSARPTPSGS